MIGGISNIGDGGTALRMNGSFPSFRTSDSEGVSIPKPKTSEYLGSGFGSDTISVPGAALRTLGSGIDGARKIVPTTGDILESMRAKAAELRKNQDEETKNRRDEAVSQATNPATAVKDLMSGMSRAAAIAQARLAGEEPPSEQRSATVQVNGQTLNYLRVQQGDTTETASRRFNVTI